MKDEPAQKPPDVDSDDMLPEYDFAVMQGGVRGKYYRAFREGCTVKILREDGSEDVRRYSPEDGSAQLVEQ